MRGIGLGHTPAMSIPIQVCRLPHAEGLPLPSYATAGAAGMDLLAAISDPISIRPGERKLIPTGLTVALPPGYELQVRPRSGLALRHGITLPNTPGTIDEDYRGEIGVILLNAGTEHVHRRARRPYRPGGPGAGEPGGVASGGEPGCHGAQ